jgi:surface antigen
MAGQARHPGQRGRLAAALVALPLAGCAGLASGDPALYQGLSPSDVGLAAQTLQTTLESAPDGASRSWSNRETGNQGAVTPLRTFVSENGSFCREYREELAVAGASGRFYHTACRDEAARWTWL